jgi:glycosyltransferase involved in cell wall biosynthesis
MVGTLEPRKGYLQAIEAFTQLWENGVDVNLVIVGRAGWQQLPPDQQRSIPQLLARLANHPEKGRRLFWLDGPSDEFLELIYSSVNGLLAASEDEGFGLPLIEAAQKGLPILARDIPVFREVATQNACYFTADDPQQLAAAVVRWVEKGFQPPSTDMAWLTWQQSAANLQHLLLDSPGT